MARFELGRAVGASRAAAPLRIAYGRVFQESNAFSPLPTTRADFEAVHCLPPQELALATRLRGRELEGFLRNAELSGFRQAARLAGNVEALPLWSTFAVSGGPVTRETFDWLVETTLSRLRDVGAIDAVYLALHGSMQVEGLDRSPEGLLLERVRELVGDDVRVAVSYDLHANLSAPMLEHADIVTAYHSNPHRDLFGTGFRAGNRLLRLLRGGFTRPLHAWRKLPMVLGGGMSIDFLAPMRAVFRRLKAMEREPGVISVNLFMVHPYSAAMDLGWAAHVCTDGDQGLADRLVDELADLAWQQRDVPLPEMHTPGGVFDAVAASPWRKLGAVSVVDVGDIVGTGAPGGNTHLLAELLERPRDLRVYLPLHDPAAVERVFTAREGERVTLELAGSPGYDEQPRPTVTAIVARKHDGDFGRTARLDVCDLPGAAALHVAVTERPPFTVTPRFWSELGLPARAADAVVQKCLFHYRMFYALSSFRHLAVESDGASSLDRVRRRDYAVPTWPMQDPGDWRTWDETLRAGSQRQRVAARAAG